MPASAGFDLALVESQIAGTRFAGKVQHFETVGSTNQLALKAAQAGATGGVWVADVQTAGRGRGGHAWHSAAGDGLYVSVLVTPKVPLELGLWLSLATGLAAQRAIFEASGLLADIRWPNDLLLAGKKCGGILVETAATAGSGALRYAVIGVGINVSHPEFPGDLVSMATSLRIAGGQPVSREQVLARFLTTLEDEIARLGQEAEGNLAGVGLLERFATASTWVRGMRVSVPEQGGYTGTTRGLDERGFLLVEDDCGVMRTVLSGGVRPE